MNQQMNPAHYQSFKLINFNVPNHLINSFDEMVKFKRITRTSLLIGLMESWLRGEVKKLEADNEFNKLVMDLKLRNKDVKPLVQNKHIEEDDKPLMPYFTNDDYDWEERFR